jgi:hypothetical protein
MAYFLQAICEHFEDATILEQHHGLSVSKEENKGTSILDCLTI